MLTEIRDRSSGVFAWFVAALIIIPMAFFGINQYAAEGVDPTIVEIGDQKISQAEFQTTLLSEQNRLREANPALANSDLLNSASYKQQVLQGLINRSLRAHIANQENYQVSSDYVSEIIRQDPSFQTDGKFDPAVYQALTASRGAGGAEQIRNQIASSARLQQVASGYAESAIVLPDEVRFLLEVQTEKRSFDRITIKRSDYLDKVTVSEDEIQDYYQQNIEQFMLPDSMVVNYIELDRAKLAESAIVDEADLQAAYDDYQANFETAEVRATRHILLSTAGDQSEPDQLAKAQDLVTQLREGADFVELAKTESDDTGSAASGGSLGDVERGQMVNEFEVAAFSLEQGVISDPIKSQFGYHIIRVDEIKGTNAESFEILRPQLEIEERDRQADELVIEQAEQLRNILFEQSDNLEPASQALNLPILATSSFSREEGEGVAANQLIRDAAFGDAVLQEGLNSELLEIADGVFIALSKKEFVESAPRSLADTSAQITQILKDEKATAAAVAAGDSVTALAADNWDALVSDESLEILSHTISLIDPDQQVPNDVVQEVMRMQLANGASQSIKTLTASNGDFNVLRLTAITAGDLDAVSEQVRNSTRNIIELRNGNLMFQAYLDGLDEELDLQINSDLL